MKLRNIHYWSGMIMTVFILLHLFNHVYSLSGAMAHIEMMDKLRLVYRNTFAETILLTAALVQISSGLKLFFQKRKTTSQSYDRLQLWSGIYLAFFLLIHLSAVLGGRYILELDTNFYFGVAGLNTFPFNLFFIPYYGLAIISFFGHITAIHYRKMNRTLMGITPKLGAQFILTIGVILSIIILYGLTDGFNWYEIPEAYDILTLKNK